MCVSLKHGLVIVSGTRQNLCMYSLVDGSLVCWVGGIGSGKGRFNYNCGGLCVSTDGDSVLIAEEYNHRVQQVRIVDGAWERFVGEGVIPHPQFLDCNAVVIAVLDAYCGRIGVLSWNDGSVLAQFDRREIGDPGRIKDPYGVRLLADGSGVVVVDWGNHRLCVFTLSGDFVTAIGNKESGLHAPTAVLECAVDGSLIVSGYWTHELIKLGTDGAIVEVYGKKGDGNGEFNCPIALAALPGGGLVVREFLGARLQIFRGLELRKAWVTVCVTLSICEWGA